MDREEIKKILPHRDNMLLLDEVAKEDDVAIGHYTVRGDEFFLKGHCHLDDKTHKLFRTN